MQRPENSTENDEKVRGESRRLFRNEASSMQEGTASTATLIHNAAHANTMKAKHRATDDLIDTLHRTLREQTLIAPASMKGQNPGNVLSGARSSRVRRIAYDRPKLSQRSSRKVKRNDRSEIGQSISRIVNLFSLSEELGIDMSKAGREIFEARGALGRGKTVSAKRHVARADRNIHEAMVNKFPSMMRDLRSSFRELEKVGASTDSTKRLAEKAKAELRKGDHQEALRLLRDARRSISDSQREVILRIMIDSKGKFVKAKKAGLDVSEAVRLVNLSRDMLRQGNFTEAVSNARESTRVVSALLDKHKEARYPLLECMKAVKVAEALGADTTELAGMLSEARSCFKQNDLERSAECSRKLIGVAKSSAYAKAAESYELAEKALLLARSAGVDPVKAQEQLDRARESLDKDNLAKSVSYSSCSMLESNSALVQALADKMKDIGEFSKGIEGEVESLTEVREALESSKERDLDALRKYSKLTEEVVGKAYESAASYSRVSQDIVKEAYQNSLGVSHLGQRTGQLSSQAESVGPALTIEDKRQKIMSMYMNGRITETQLDRLLMMIDSSVAKDNLV